jgi:putative SOS response-associated peptidase YedK
MSTINARAESITTASMWREPVRKRRCLVPADAFYEWPKASNGRSRQMRWRCMRPIPKVNNARKQRA